MLELAYARRPRRLRAMRPKTRRRLLRDERRLRWTAFGLILFASTQYLSLSNLPAAGLYGLGLLVGVCWLAAVAGVGVALVRWKPRRRRTLLARGVVAALMFAAIFGIGQSRWLFRANFALSRPFLDAAADRVQRGGGPMFCGGLLVTDWQLHDPQTVGLYFSRTSSGWTGLVRHPADRPVGRRVTVSSNNGGPEPLGGGWELVDED